MPCAHGPASNGLTRLIRPGSARGRFFRQQSARGFLGLDVLEEIDAILHRFKIRQNRARIGLRWILSIVSCLIFFFAFALITDRGD